MINEKSVREIKREYHREMAEHSESGKEKLFTLMAYILD